MPRKRVTEIFPCLIPLRRWQRKRWYYRRMERDGNRYAGTIQAARLPVELFHSACPMINADTGFDLAYQENKVFNLKLAAKCLDGLLIRPGETFSFWHSVRYADRDTPYRDGLAEINGKLTTQYGGGLCMMTNLLFWLFLHSPLTIVERRGHDVKDFPEPASDAPLGVDATVAEGWLDLKVQNNTSGTYQLCITFDEMHIIGRLMADQDDGRRYQAVNRDLRYVREEDGVYEDVTVCQIVCRAGSGEQIEARALYRNRCRIGYALPAGTEITERRKEQ